MWSVNKTETEKNGEKEKLKGVLLYEWNTKKHERTKNKTERKPMTGVEETGTEKSGG